MIYLINICRIISAYKETNLKYRIPHSLFTEIPRANGVKIFFNYDCVVKTIENFFKNMDSANKEDLLEIYKLTEKNLKKTVKISINTESRSKDKIHLNIYPLCLPSKQVLSSTNLIKALKDIAEALDSLHKNGFVHRDLRWDNILYDAFNREEDERHFLLADFEHSGKKDAPIKMLTTFYPPHFGESFNFTEKHDMYMFGQLIEEARLNLKINIPKLQELENTLIGNNNTLTNLTAANVIDKLDEILE